MRAEYDHENNRVVALEMDDGRKALTNTPRVLGAKTEWLPVTVVYPDGYDQRYNSLLDPGHVEYRFAEDHVEVHYPNADFSPEAIRLRLRQSISTSAKRLLNDTDWYFIRQLDTGEPIPEDVQSERQAIRDKAHMLTEEVDQLPDDELRDFDFSFTTDTPQPARLDPREPIIPGTDGSEWVTDATAPSQKGEPVRPAEPTELNVTEVRPPRTPTGLPWSLSDDGKD